ncbi:hypothetical protein N1031_06965 [Herbiconiux moechotypicola]|uniref:DUF732 domain-containing protein n=1 Tax=Herbiconiux moechotypicola TaxID=637393 RepID=A0ABN3DGN9_9MICO|nr:hypothetical protein [Herbiconiux moechotypicola]MCS5729497.1 hypothetical protein [Herbiconiux moechotypicola]
MRKTFTVLVLAMGLVLAGCSTTSAESEAAVESTPTAAPITAAAEEPTEAAALTDDEVSAYFLDSVKPTWRGAEPTDEELLSAAELVCEQLAGGATVDSVVVVEGEGEDADWNNFQLVNRAADSYC